MERKHKHLFETASALLFQSRLPIQFWKECVLIATYLINRFSSTILSNKTPFEILHGHLPTYDHLRSFSCLAYATVPIPLRDKFQSRIIPSHFLGYPFGKKGYKLLNLQTKFIFYSWDVSFVEHNFPSTSSPSTVFSPIMDPNLIFRNNPSPSIPIHSPTLSTSTPVVPPLRRSSRTTQVSACL